MTNDFFVILSARNFLFGYVTILLLLHVSLLKKKQIVNLHQSKSLDSFWQSIVMTDDFSN